MHTKADASSVQAGGDPGPLVTIAIPTFNRASWLRGCIVAALAQTYPRVEIIVSDNASTDNTAEVLKGFSDPRLRVLRQATNLGPTPNLNACLAAARGDYIVFVPDDDRAAPWLVERCIALVKGAPSIPVVIAVGDIYMVAEGRTLPAKGGRELRTGIWDGTDILREYLEDHVSAHVCTTMYRTEVLRANGGVPDGWPFAGDIATFIPLLLRGQAGFVGEACGLYCVHGESQTSAMETNVRLKDIRRLLDLIDQSCRLADPKKRHELDLAARRYFARHALGIIATRRRHGATLAEVLPLIREWGPDLRAGLSRPGMDNALNVVESIVLLLLPGPITRWIRQGLRRYREVMRTTGEAPAGYALG
jgi:glycosyltransferase involved in cell wall biosynthesis